jgi:type IV pilus assembly protein PilZ
LVELRRFLRTPLDEPVTFTRKGTTEVLKARAKDVSVGGMFVETPTVPPFGTEVTIRVKLPHGKDELSLPGLVRWVRSDGMGVQFGNLGAKETHEITEVVRRAETGES